MVLGFSLLESCELSETDEKFILTALDFKVGKRDKNLLAQVKNSLRKFQSRMMTDDGRDGRIHVKMEEVYLSEALKVALRAEGWTPPSSSHSVPQNSPLYKGKKNPLDENGKPLRCFKCESEYHMADKCKKDAEKRGESTKLSTLLARVSESSFSM